MEVIKSVMLSIKAKVRVHVLLLFSDHMERISVSRVKASGSLSGVGFFKVYVNLNWFQILSLQGREKQQCKLTT